MDLIPTVDGSNFNCQHKILKCQEENHENEEIIAICTKKDCEFPSRLMCISCLTSDHCDHCRFGMKVNEFNPSRNVEDIVLNWKGDSELPSNMIAGLKKFSKEINIQNLNKELDEFEKTIIQEIKDIRKQILSCLNLKKEEGDEEFSKVTQHLSEFLQINKIQKLLSNHILSKSGEQLDKTELNITSDETEQTININQSISKNLSDNEKGLSADEINKSLSKIIEEMNDKSSQQYRNCIDLMCNSDCIFSYSLQLDKIKEEQNIIQKQIQSLSSKISKITQQYFFQSSMAYDSKNTIKIKDNNTTAVFTNINSYSVAYLNAQFNLDSKPVKILFQFDQSLLKQHFCIGLRKEAVKDEDSYNKSPYKCLHCQIGDGILQDSGLHNSLTQSDQLYIKFDPKLNYFLISSLNGKITCKLSYPSQDKNSDNNFRLYFWRGSSQVPTSVKILKID